MKTPHIAIVGAGLGGLTCARVLRQHGRAVTVLEREPGPDSRAQGGSLDLHGDTGQVALRTAGLHEQFRALARPAGQEMRDLDPSSGTVVAHQLPAADDEFKPEIDRGQLRGLLLDSLADGTVRWGSAVDDAAGLQGEFDLVIGADGAWSRVRTELSTAVPVHTGVNFVEFGLDEVDRRLPRSAALAGQGSAVAVAGGRGVFLQRNSGGRLRCYLMFRGERDWAARAGLDLADTGSVRDHLLAVLAGFDERLLDLVRGHDGGFIDRPLYALLVPHTWSHRPGFTLLGDAAHLMPPLGVGANLAMLDGAELATALVQEPDLDAAVAGYEAVMFARSAPIAAACVQGLQDLLDGIDLDPSELSARAS